MELAKNTGEIATHNLDPGHIDPDRRIDTQHKFSDFNLSDLKPDIDRRIPVETKEKNELKELTPEQKDFNAQKLGYSLDKISAFKIDGKGVLHYDTINSKLEGTTAENGVPFRRKTVEINGVKIEGVFPEFKAKCEVQLDPKDFQTANYADLCNKKMGFEKTPEGYVWHHNEEPGKMQLVKQECHEGARHTGGSFLWGPGAGSYNGGTKGVHF